MGEVYRARDTEAAARRRDQGAARGVRSTTPSGSCASSARRGCSPRSTTPTSPRSTASRSRAARASSSWSSSRARRSTSGIAEGPLPLDEALAIAAQIAAGLEAAHEAGIIHRDLKPSNVKLRPDGSVKVLDLGLARSRGRAGRARLLLLPDAHDSRHARGGVILGTAAYMSPEQARGKALDKRTDIFSFGCVALRVPDGPAGVLGRNGHRHPLGDPLERTRTGRRCPPGRPRRFATCCAAACRRTRSAACTTSPTRASRSRRRRRAEPRARPRPARPALAAGGRLDVGASAERSPAPRSRRPLRRFAAPGARDGPSPRRSRGPPAPGRRHALHRAAAARALAGRPNRRLRGASTTACRCCSGAPSPPITRSRSREPSWDRGRSSRPTASGSASSRRTSSGRCRSSGGTAVSLSNIPPDHGGRELGEPTAASS